MKSGEVQTKLGKLKSREVKIFNIFKGQERIYIGYNFFILLDLVYRAKLRNNRKFSFIARDGYYQFARDSVE